MWSVLGWRGIFAFEGFWVEKRLALLAFLMCYLTFFGGEGAFLWGGLMGARGMRWGVIEGRSCIVHRFVEGIRQYEDRVRRESFMMIGMCDVM